MPVELGPDGGRRFNTIEIEVPGTPEEVWQAIATGPGITSWFVPTELEERVGGSVLFHLDEEVQSAGTVTAWSPPHRLVYEEPDWNPPAPPLATEHVVEASSGAMCRVRIVSSLFTGSDEWDDQLETMDTGWRPFFDILRLVLTHYRCLPAYTMQQMRPTKMSEAEAWAAVSAPLGSTSVKEGAPVSAPSADVPPFEGTVERTQASGTMRNVQIRLTQPASGIASLTTHGAGDTTYVGLGFYLFGEDAEEAVRRDGERWKAFMDAVFPPST
jgi:uncharacterized protein YndB with AHSA1/START domain